MANAGWSGEARPEAVVIAAKRTAIGRAGGMFQSVNTETLLALAIRAVLDESGIDPSMVDEVVVGNAAGPGGNLARLGLLTAGLPLSVPGLTIDRQCGSGLDAINLASNLVRSGSAEIVLAGGVESPSTAPWRVSKPGKNEMPRFYNRARFSPASIGDPEMGEAAENVASTYGITRERQDDFAARSHRLAFSAQQDGLFEAEILTVAHNGEDLRTDECVRPSAKLESLSRLKPAFVPGGTVTAGNACPINDGASMVVVTTREIAQRLGFDRVLAFVDSAVAGVDPNLLGIGAVASTQALQKRQPALDLGSLDVIEFNEAFASQTLASLDLLGIEVDRVNRNGGALAIGHPFGASGAILVTRIYAQLVRQRSTEIGATAMAMMATAGGLGVSTLFELAESA